MNNQFTFLEQSEEDWAIELVSNSLNEVLSESGLGGLFVTVSKNKTAYSIAFKSSVIVRISVGKTPRIEFPSYKNGKKSFEKIKLSSIIRVEDYLEQINFSLRNILTTWPKDFSCCSRYELCSDNKSCIHPDKDFALGCYYRKNLVSGKIFYGKNQNNI